MDTARALTRRGSRTALVAAAAATLVFLPLATSAPASAHDQLVASDPAADSTVEVLPDELTLVFSGELIDAGDGTAVEVLSPAGDDVAGDPELSGTDVTVPLAGGAAGEYEVTWRVVSNDGHPIDGTFSFAAETASAADAAGSDGAAEQTDEATADASGSEDADAPADAGGAEEADAAEGAPAGADSFQRNLPWIVGGLVVVAGGGAVIAMAVLRTRRGYPPAGDARTDDPAGGDPDSER
ncbi:copper resistance CopC family protein [Microbacterium halophytorum]|uniref:copper resistance CopC family protein n=1 Tax=Microbacterium halophytorum TaxID=2067568 RepID=UPI000CFD382E|nr:copper resistance CopC family protein [Microbacterium halophytorum]